MLRDPEANERDQLLARKAAVLQQLDRSRPTVLGSLARGLGVVACGAAIVALLVWAGLSLATASVPTLLALILIVMVLK